jgi:hypothetical protein
VTGNVLGSLRLFPQLKTLVLSGSKITDPELEQVAAIKPLQTLLLDSTSVTYAGLKHLHALKSLQVVDLTGTKATDAGADELKQAIPKPASSSLAHRLPSMVQEGGSALFGLPRHDPRTGRFLAVGNSGPPFDDRRVDGITYLFKGDKAADDHDPA